MLKAKLIATGSNVREIEIASDDLPLIFGRGPQAGIRIDDRWTSRSHCELSEVDGVLWIYDLGSTHGTYLNGLESSESALADGDTIQVGLSNFRVHYEPAAVSVSQFA